MISMANQLFPMAQRAFYSFLCCKTGSRRCISSCHVFSSELLEVIIVGKCELTRMAVQYVDCICMIYDILQYISSMVLVILIAAIILHDVYI